MKHYKGGDQIPEPKRVSDCCGGEVKHYDGCLVPYCGCCSPSNECSKCNKPCTPIPVVEDITATPKCSWCGKDGCVWPSKHQQETARKSAWDSSQGQTHFQNDGCGEPDHNEPSKLVEPSKPEPTPAEMQDAMEFAARSIDEKPPEPSVDDWIEALDNLKWIRDDNRLQDLENLFTKLKWFIKDLLEQREHKAEERAIRKGRGEGYAAFAETMIRGTSNQGMLADKVEEAKAIARAAREQTIEEFKTDEGYLSFKESIEAKAREEERKRIIEIVRTFDCNKEGCDLQHCLTHAIVHPIIDHLTHEA